MRCLRRSKGAWLSTITGRRASSAAISTRPTGRLSSDRWTSPSTRRSSACAATASPARTTRCSSSSRRSTRASCTSVASAARMRRRARIWTACPMSRHVASFRCPTRFSPRHRFRREVCRSLAKSTPSRSAIPRCVRRWSRSAIARRMRLSRLAGKVRWRAFPRRCVSPSTRTSRIATCSRKRSSRGLRIGARPSGSACRARFCLLTRRLWR